MTIFQNKKTPRFCCRDVIFTPLKIFCKDFNIGYTNIIDTITVFKLFNANPKDTKMYMIKQLIKLIPSIGYIILSIIDLYKLIAIVLSSCDIIQLLISSILGLCVLILFIIKPDTECILHECGHVIAVLYIGVISKLDVQVSVAKVGNCFKTSSNIDEWLNINRKYFFIRIYSLGGLFFIMLICTMIDYVSFTVKHCIYIKCFLLFASNTFIYQELVGLCNGIKTNDLNVFLHPENFNP